MVSKIFVVLQFIAFCSGAYYDPPASVCPTKVEVTPVNIETRFSQIKVVPDGPYTDLDCHIKDEIDIREVVATNVVISTTIVTLPHQIFTKAVIRKTPKDVTITEVQTVSKTLEYTDFSIVTATATNFHTDIDTKSYTETVYKKNHSITTKFKDVPSTTTYTESSTYTITKSPIITTEVTSYVPYTQAVYVTLHSAKNVITHTSTETRTRTVCQQPLHHY